MALAQKTLIDIADLSQRVVNALDRLVGHKTSESSQLARIVVGSRTALEALNRSFLFKDGNVDDRLLDWLNTEEPIVCLRTLNEMGKTLDRKVEYGMMGLLKSSRSTQTQDKVGEATRLFQMRKSYFHFLLTASVWNRESGTQHPPPLAVQPDVSRVNQASNGRFLAMSMQFKDDDDDASSVANARKTSMTKRKQGANLEKLDSILEWLDAWNTRETHERTILLRQPDTCTWLSKTDAYMKWSSAENSFLWLRGKAGAGKSVIAAYVIEDLQNAPQDGEVVAYFYCNFREERSTSAVEVLRSLLSQLLKQFRFRALDPGDLLDKLAEEKNGGASTINNVTFLTRHVSHAAKQFHKPPFIVIDALDECKDVEELLGALTTLRRGSVRLLALSRPLHVIKNEFSCVPFIDMDEMEHEVSTDIRLHITRELDSHHRLRLVDAVLKDEVYSTLCGKAAGMFRWVQCQLTALKRCVTMVDFREVLDGLPGDLDETYGRILLAIDRTQGHGHVVRRALDWLVVALEPLQLSQIMEGLSIDIKQRALSCDSVPIHGAILLDALSSLVIYSEETDVVILSHFSVKEYLIAESTRKKYPTYYVDRQAAHTQLASFCLCYVGILLRYGLTSGDESSLLDPHKPWIRRVNTNATTSHSRKRPESPLRSNESHPLLRYVFSLGFCHLEYVNPRNRTVLRAIKNFQLDVGQHPSEWEQLCERAGSSSLPYCTSKHDVALYILIAFAPEPLLCSFIDHTWFQPKDGTNPLVYAAYFCKSEHARSLLSRGANVNHKGLDVGYPDQVLPLEVAVREGNHDMVDLLLDKGSHVPHSSFKFILEDVIFIAPADIALRLVRTDEFVEWAAEYKAKDLLLGMLDWRIFGYPAFSPEDISILQQRFIQIGCYPPAGIDEASVRRAVSEGHVPIIEHMLSQNALSPSDILLATLRGESWNAKMIHLCLDIGCEVDVASPAGDTPIHAVLNSDISESGCLERIRVLVDAGCNPSSHNLTGDSPLHLAARRGYVSIVEYLLGLQVPLPPDIFLTVSEATVIRLLLHRIWDDTRAIAVDGYTPLHLVLQSKWSGRSSGELVTYVKMLINAGCDPCLPNALGETPLDLAARHGHFLVMQFLLSIGVPLSPSVLLYVVGDRFADGTAMVRLLVGKGADVHVTGPNGDTLLHLAISAEYSEFLTDIEVECLERVKILVGAGCDPRARNSAGSMPFHVAASKQVISVMEYLFSLGVSVPPDILHFLLQRRLDFFARAPYSAARFLLDNGGDVHALSKDGDTLLHVASELWEERSALEFVKLFVDAGCTPSLPNLKHQTPLHVAAREGRVSVVRYFLSLGLSLPPDILLAASVGRSPRRMIRYLVEEGADVSVVSAGGDTPLHLLMADYTRDENVRLDCARILVDSGCDPRVRNAVGETALHTAARSGFITSLEYLLLQGVPLGDDILLASAPRTTCFFAKRGVDLRCVAVDVGVRHALEYPCTEEDCLESIKILVSAGWDASLWDSAGNTPIHIAAKRGYISVVQYLLSQGVPLPLDVLLAAVPDDEYWERFKHNPKIRVVPLIRFLVHKRASVSATTANGDTPLHLALRLWSVGIGEKGEDEVASIVKILLDCGADPTARNVGGQTPFDIAEMSGRFFKDNFLRLVRVCQDCMQSDPSRSKPVSSALRKVIAKLEVLNVT